MPHFVKNWPYMPKPIRTKKPDWKDRCAAFGVHFFFGAILGSAFGLGFWAYHFSEEKTATVGLLCIGGGALLCGIAAGIARDEFWTDLWKKMVP